MPDPKGIQSELIGPMEYSESGHVVDLYVNYEGLEMLRNNTTRELSKYFDGLVKEVDGRIAEFDADKHMEQDPLPGL